MAQTWNDVLEYIKLDLGATINLLELSDDEILKYIKHHVLPYFSQYFPAKKFVLIDATNDLIPEEDGQPRYRYKIPVPDDEYIVDIYDIYLPMKRITADLPVYGYVSAIETVLNNEFVDILNSLNSANTWDFIPPRTIILDKKPAGEKFIVVYNTVHETPETIRPDMYHLAFKPLCSAYVKMWIGKMRSKFQALTTSFGSLNVNWQELYQEGLQEKANIEQKMFTTPPDHFVKIF